MSCSIEMLPCDHCGREVERYHIHLVRNEAGERQFFCPECAGHPSEPPTAPAAPAVRPRCD